MQNLTKLHKIFLSLTVLLFTIWLGGYIARQAIVYQFFEPQNLNLRPIFNDSNLPQVLITILPVIVLNLITYIGFCLLLVLFLLISKVSLKNEGWLFISVLIFSICAPFEFYLLFKDYKIINAIYSTNFNGLEVINMLRERLTVLNSFSLIEIFCSFVIIFLGVLQPLRKR